MGSKRLALFIFTHLSLIEVWNISLHPQLLRGCWIICKLPQEEPAERRRRAAGSCVSAALCWTAAGLQPNLTPNFTLRSFNLAQIKEQTLFQPTKQKQTEMNLTRDKIKKQPKATSADTNQPGRRRSCVPAPPSQNPLQGEMKTVQS